MVHIDPDNESEEKELKTFLESAREILIDGVKDALKDKKLKDIRTLYELAGKISGELGDSENQKMFDTRFKLFHKQSIEKVIENINLTIKSIVQIVHYEILDSIKKTLHVIETLLNVNEINIAEKVFKRQHAQLNFLLIQYIRKMRILIQELHKLVPTEVIQESLNEWKNEYEILKIQINKLKVKSELRTKKRKLKTF